MTYYYAPSYAVTPNQGYYVVQNSGTSSDTSWSDELKKAGSNFVEWLRSSKLPKGWSKGTPRCFSCHKTGATIKFSGDVAFCSQKCHHDALQKYQKELGSRKCKLQGCQETCYIENNGKVYDFCSKSHAQEYQKREPWQQFQKQQQQKPKQQQYAHDKSCKLPGCNKSCYSEHGQTYDFCGRSHAEMYKQHYMQLQRNQYGQQQRGNLLYHQPQWTHTGPINFYNRDEPYYEFTNFASYCVTIDDNVWPTTEHYFQAQKFVGTPYEETIRQMSFPREAFDFSRKPEVSYWRRSDWEQVKEDVMHKALLAKFTQHENLCRLLLSTEDRKLVEHTKNDSYWGDGGDGSGKNRLGILLMKVRETLRRPKVISLPSPPPQPTTAMQYEDMQSKSPPHTDSNDEENLMDITESPTSPLTSPKGPSTGPLMSPHDATVDKILSMPISTRNAPPTGTLHSEMPTTSATTTSVTGPTGMGSSSHSTANYIQNNPVGQLVGTPSDSTSAISTHFEALMSTSTGMGTNQPTLVGKAVSPATSATTHGDTQHLDNNTMETQRQPQ